MSGAPTKLKAANLWLKTSAAGNPYFTGRLGGVKVLILENRARASENDPTHHFFLSMARTPRLSPQERRQYGGRRSGPITRPPLASPMERIRSGREKPIRTNP
jgi:hypothetical protein